MVRIAECGWNQIVDGVNAPIIAERQRPIPSGTADRPPQVDDLEAMLQEIRNIFRREMTMYASDGRLRRLINVHLSYRLTLIRTIVDLSRTAATKSWDENMSVSRG